MAARSGKVPGRIGALPVINTGGAGNSFKAAAALLTPLAAKANEIADREAVEKAQSEGIVAGDTGSFIQRSSNRLSGRAFNASADIALKGRLDSDFKTALLQAEEEFSDDPAKFNEKIGGFLVGQMDEATTSSPNVALFHKQSAGPSITAATARVQGRHERKVDRQSLGAMGQYEETMLREGTIVAQSMSGASPNAWANGEEWLLHNFNNASIQWSQMAASGGTLLSPAQRTGKHIAFGQEFADNLLRGMGTNSIDPQKFRDELASGTVKIPMVVEDGGKPEVVQVNPFTVLPRSKVDAILRHVDAEIQRREREKKGADAQTKFNMSQIWQAETFKAGMNGSGEPPPMEVTSAILGEAAAIQLQDKFNSAIEENTMRNTAIGQSGLGRDATQVQLDDVAQSEAGDVQDIRRAEAFRAASGRIDAALQQDGFAAVGEMDSFVQSQRQEAIDSGTPEAFQGYVQASKEAQIEQGIAPSKARVTSNQDIAGMVEVLDSTTSGVQVREFIAAQSQHYGAHSPQMFAEMVSEGGASDLLPILANLPPTGPASSMMSSLIAGEVKQSDLDKLVATDDRKVIGESVADKALTELDPYLPPGNTSTRLAYRRAIKLLATQLVSSGKNPDEATETAYETLFGSNYKFVSNSVRVPKAAYDANVDRALRDVSATMEILGGRLDEAVTELVKDFEVVSQDPRFPADLVQEQYLHGLQANGHLITNSDETGVILYDHFNNPVVDADDNPITVTWDELRSAGVKNPKPSPQDAFIPRTRSRL